MLIETVTGPVAPDEVGLTLPHEHVFVSMFASDGITSLQQTEDDELLATELVAFQAIGGTCLVDQTPRGAGRDPRRLRAMSQRTGLQIVMGCGWYTEPFYPAADNLARRSTADLADLLVTEIEEGVDGSDVKPGIIGEIGAAQAWVSPIEERVHRAAARAQVRTGLPLATHTLYATAGDEQMRIFEDEGVDPAKVCLGHSDTDPNLAYCERILGWGAYVGLDNIGQQLGEHEPRVRKLIMELVQRGHLERLLLSHDVGQTRELRAFGGRGYTYLAETFLPLLVGDLGEDAIRMLTVENPRRFLAVD